MRFLLDTHVLLWLRDQPEQLSSRARSALAAADASLFLSVVSGWEIASKQASGKLVLPDAAGRWLENALRELRCEPLALNLAHAVEAAALPRHHKDPFDRFIIAQARVEGLTLVTKDRDFTRYDVELLRA